MQHLRWIFKKILPLLNAAAYTQLVTSALRLHGWLTSHSLDAAFFNWTTLYDQPVGKGQRRLKEISLRVRSDERASDRWFTRSVNQQISGWREMFEVEKI